MIPPVETQPVETAAGPKLRLRPGCAVLFVLVLIALGAVPGGVLYWAQVRRSQGVHVVTTVLQGVRNVAFVGSAEIAVLRGDGALVRFTLDGKATKGPLFTGAEGPVLEILPGELEAVVGGDPLALVDLEDGTIAGRWSGATGANRQGWRRSGMGTDGTHRASVALDGSIAVFAAPSSGVSSCDVISLDKRKVLGSLKLTGEPLAVALSPDSREVLVTTDGGNLELFDVRKRKSMRTLSTSLGYGGAGGHVAWAADGKHVVTTDYSGVTIYDTATWGATTAGGSRGEIFGLAISPDGLRAATIADGAPNRIALWDLVGASQIGDVKVPGRSPVALVFSPDGRTIVGAGDVRGGQGVVFRVDLAEAGK